MMDKIPINLINEWFDTHEGGVFRSKQAVSYIDDTTDSPRNTFESVFITRIGDNFYVANEKDIYNNCLGVFYDDIGVTNKQRVEHKNIIRAYLIHSLFFPICFYDFGNTRELIWHYQDLPWFEEGEINRIKFLQEVYKCIKK